MKVSHRRAMVRAALSGALDAAATSTDPIFGLHVPTAIPGIPAAVLDPRGTWPDPAAYDAQAKRLAAMFHKNFEQFGSASDTIRTAGPVG